MPPHLRLGDHVSATHCLFGEGHRPHTPQQHPYKRTVLGRNRSTGPMTNPAHSSYDWWKETEAIPPDADGSFDAVPDPGGLMPSDYQNYYHGQGFSDLSGGQLFGFAPDPSYVDPGTIDNGLVARYGEYMGGPAGIEPTAMDRDH